MCIRIEKCEVKFLNDYFGKYLFSPKLEEEFSNVADVFRFLLQVFPLFRLRKIKIRLRVFIFCEGEFLQLPKTYVTHCTSIATR